MDTHELAAAPAREKEREKKGDTAHPNIRRIDNTIYFTDRITHQTAHQLNILLKSCELDILDDVRDAEEAAKKSKAKYAVVRVEPKPIRLILSTYGGLVHAAFSVVDTIKSLAVPVHTVVNGYVASAGTLISLAGAKRVMTPNSFMMIHEVRSGFWGRYSDVRTECENITKLMDHIIAYYAGCTLITSDRLREMLRSDNDISAKEALALGLVDDIGGIY